MSRLLIKGAQIVTMDDAIGDFDSADLLIENGAIVKVGPSIDAAGAEIIDASGVLAGRVPWYPGRDPQLNSTRKAS